MSPTQISVLNVFVDRFGLEFTLTTVEIVSEHPLFNVPITEYEVETEGLAVTVLPITEFKPLEGNQI